MLPFNILFQNNYFIIIDKPAGMPVYSNAKNHLIRSVEDYFPLLSKRKDGPWLVHRLDQDTSGCLLIALRKQALIKAQSCFSQHKTSKIYWAVVQGKPITNSGVITAPLLKTTQNHQWKIKADPKGQTAITKWKILKGNDSYSLLELDLLTGRTHQARVHCAVLGYPIIGDSIYGNSKNTKTPLQLLSRTLTIPLDPIISATAPIPDHINRYINEFNL